MDDFFESDESLYRAVFPPERMRMFWKSDGTITSAALKDKKGLSVERGYYRSDQEVMIDMRKSFIGRIISLSVGQCRAVGALVIYLPGNSIYHSEIHGSKNQKILSNHQSHVLASQAILIDEHIM